MPCIKRRSVVRLVVFGTLCYLAPGGPSRALGHQESDWKKPFRPDEHTVVLYHFDEGQGNEARDACGDGALTLRAHKTALWGSRPGFGTTARFARRADDADLHVGPIGNDKLHLKTCTEAWTVEAWIRYTGPAVGEAGTLTYAHICGTDDEGFGLPDGKRGGYSFTLGGSRPYKDGLLPTARFLGSTSSFLFPRKWTNKYEGRHIADSKWHHVAWQFRYKDQLNTFFLDGELFKKISLFDPGAPGIIVNNAENNCVPFVVGGVIHSQDPPYYIKSGNFEGEIDELRISQIMRYPVTRELAIIRQKLPRAGLKIPYSVELATDAAEGQVAWELLSGKLPEGLALDKKHGAIHGKPLETVVGRTVTVGATDAAGQTDKHTFSLTVVRGRLVTKSLPPAFAGAPYHVALKMTHMTKPARWAVVSGTLPPGIVLNDATGQLEGTPAKKGSARLAIQVTDANGLRDHCDLVLRVLPQELRVIKADANTVVLYDWQGPNGKLIQDVMGDKELTMSYTNMGGDNRVSWPGREGRFPQDIGHGEHGMVTKVKGHPKLDLKTCRDEWTVEAWVSRGGPIRAFGDKVSYPDHQPFDFGHICGTYDNSKRGVWELYLSDHDSPDGSMAPGCHFLGAEPDQALMDLHPWKRPQGIVGNPEEAGIRDTEWHHLAWQYNYAEDLHQLFLDGRLIWQMKSPDGRKLVNNRQHDAQFSVSTRITGDVPYYTLNNYLGYGNFFGRIGEIRISNTRRY